MSERTDTQSDERFAVPNALAEAALVLVPVAYAVLSNFAFQSENHSTDVPSGLVGVALWVLKLVSMPALAIGVHRIGRQVARRPASAQIAAATWAAVGSFMVVAVSWLKNRGVALGVDQLWPGQTDPELLAGLTSPPGTGWQPTGIVAAEIAAIVIMAIGVAAIFKLRQRGLEPVVVTALAIGGVYAGLLLYDGIVGWPVMWDYDPFVGDAVLGTLSFELFFFFGPIDPVGAIGLAAIGVANGLILTATKRLR